MENTRINILNAIIAKGGIYAPVAQMYLHDEDKGIDFIKECFLQCHNQAVWNYWGIELILEIISYWIKHLRLLYEECLLLQARLKLY